MPSEIRRIEFSEIEVINALSLYQSKLSGRKGRMVNVTNLRIAGGNDFNIVARVPCENQGVKNQVFDYGKCLGAFLLFAKTNAIPLPKLGNKILSPSKFKGVIMTVKYQLAAHQIADLMKMQNPASSLH